MYRNKKNEMLATLLWCLAAFMCVSAVQIVYDFIWLLVVLIISFVIWIARKSHSLRWVMNKNKRRKPSAVIETQPRRVKGVTSKVQGSYSKKSPVQKVTTQVIYERVAYFNFERLADQYIAGSIHNSNGNVAVGSDIKQSKR